MLSDYYFIIVIFIRISVLCIIYIIYIIVILSQRHILKYSAKGKLIHNLAAKDRFFVWCELFNKSANSKKQILILNEQIKKIFFIWKYQ